MKMDREKLKELLKEDHQHTVSSEDVEAVARMLAVLDNEDNAIRLPANFSDKVIKRVLQKQVNENRFGWFGYFLGIFSLIICLIVSLAAVDFKLDFGFLKNISSYSGLLIFGVAFIFFLNVVEKKLIKFSSE